MAISDDITPVKHPVSSQLTRRILPVYLVIATLFAVLQLSSAYFNERKVVQLDLEGLERAFAPGLSESLWDMNRPGLSAILDGMQEMPLVSGVTVTHPDMKKIIAVKGQCPQEGTPRSAIDFYSHQFIVTYQHASGTDPLAIVTLFAEKRQVWSRLKTELIKFLTYIVTTTVALWLIVKLATLSILSNPLKRITSLTNQLDFNHLENVSIDSGIKDDNELKAMEKACNTMLRRLELNIRERDSLQDSLRDYRDSLEEQVVERTEELITAKDKAETASRAKSEFLANMSHEIRTPMNAVLGFTEILGGIENDPRKSHYIECIRTSGKTLLNIINDILDLSKVEAGKLELHYTAVSVATLLAEMNVTFDHKIADKGLEFYVSTGDDLPASLLLDASRLRQVLINLIGNAVKFTDYGEIRLSAFTNPPVGDCRSAVDLCIEVSDTGRGIPIEEQDNIFKAFEQAAGQKEARFGGTGLGLTISNRLVNMMGGTLSIHSTPDNGATFRIELGDVEICINDAHEQEDEFIFDVNSVHFEPATILIADDIDYNREILTTYLKLKPWPFTFIYAENGKVAVDLARHHTPDLILLDMKMPIMDGYQAAEILRADPTLTDMSIIAVTASVLNEEEHAIRRLTDVYLRKPISSPVLIRALMQCLPHRITTTEDVDAPPDDSLADASELSTDEQKVLNDELAKMTVLSDGLCKNLLLGKVGEFAEKLNALSGEFPDRALVEYSDTLNKAFAVFDCVALKKHLKQFPPKIKP